MSEKAIFDAIGTLLAEQKAESESSIADIRKTLDSIKSIEPVRGEDGVGIEDVVSVDDGFKITLTNGVTKSFNVNVSDGIGIKAVEQADNAKSFDLVFDNDERASINLPEPLTGDKGEKGDSGIDRPIAEVRKACDGLPANEICTFDGGLYQTTKQTIGTPEDDAGAYRLVLNGIEKAHSKIDWEAREYEIGVRLTNGEQVKSTVPMAPTYVDDSVTTLLKGDYRIDESVLKVYDGHAWSEYDLRGARGRTGRTGVGIKSVKAAAGDILVEMSDGKAYSLPIVESVLETLVTEYKEVLIDLTVPIAEDISEEIKRYAGIHQPDKSYSKGDVVTTYQGLYLALKSTSMPVSTRDDWAFMLGIQSSGAGGGGGGGQARTTTILADGALNMGGFSIQSLKDPRAGAVGKQDATNRNWVEQAIAAGALYQGIYTVATNTPNLQAKADAAFTHPAAGSTIAKPNPAAPDVTDPQDILTWHNWGGHGFDAFAATTTRPTPFEVRLSNGLIHKFNIPPAVYGDEAALKAALDAEAAAVGVVSFEVYVNGADCHIGVETVAPLYCTAIGGETGNAFPVATEGAGNTILNTYNWIVSTISENEPMALPGGIVGLPAGTVVKNSDVLQWSSAIHGFEVISGSSLTQSFSDQRYWQVNGNNMRWQDQAYNKGSIVYSESRNSWFVATQNIPVGSPEPGSLAAGAMFRKVNSTYGSTVFFGRGDFDHADTTALNNWGMPPQTYPPGQQPLNGDTYFDVLSGSTTDFTVTQHPPSFTLSGTFDEATQDLGYEFWGARYDIQTWPVDAPAVPPAIGSGWHGTTLAAGLAIMTGTFAGTQIRPNSHYFVIWSGDPDADHDGWVLIQRENPPVVPPAGWNKWTTTTVHPQSVVDTVTGITVYGFERNVEIPISVGATVGLDIMLAKNLPNTSWRLTGELIDLTDGTICEFFVTNIAGTNKPEITPVNVLPAGTPGIDEIIVHHSTASGIFLTGKLNANGRGRTYKLELTTEDFDLGLVIHGDGVEHEGGRTSGFYALSKYPAQLIPMQLIGAKASNADFAKGTMLRIPANVIAGHIYQVAAVVRGTYDNESDYFVTQLGISINGGNTIPHNKTFSVNKSGWYESTINSMDIWKATVSGPVEFDLTCISYSGGVQFRSTNMTVIDMGTG